MIKLTLLGSVSHETRTAFPSPVQDSLAKFVALCHKPPQAPASKQCFDRAQGAKDEYIIDSEWQPIT